MSVTGSRELSLDELLDKVRELERLRRRPEPVVKRTSTPPPPEQQPSIDTSLPSNVTAQLGGSAFLRCRVVSLNNRAVSFPVRYLTELDYRCIHRSPLTPSSHLVQARPQLFLTTSVNRMQLPSFVSQSFQSRPPSHLCSRPVPAGSLVHGSCVCSGRGPLLTPYT